MLLAQAFGKYAADTEDIGEEQGGDCEGNDGVEGNCGAKIDEGDDDAAYERYYDCVQGYWMLGVDLRQNASVGADCITSLPPFSWFRMWRGTR